MTTFEKSVILKVISIRMGPDPTPLALSQEEPRTQIHTKKRPHEDTPRRQHLRAKERGLRRTQTCPQLGLRFTVLNSEEN